MSVNCSHVCIIYAEIYEKISSGGLEVSLSIVLSVLYLPPNFQKLCMAMDPFSYNCY